MNAGIILAAGNSSRFQNTTPKQLFEINGKPIINWSIDVLNHTIDDIVIVTNTNCSSQIKTTNKIVINDIDNRIQSIKVGLNFLQGKKYSNILIHDAARPFIKEHHILDLLESQKENLHSQYFLPIVNGLLRKTENILEVAPREDFIEICTPQITNFELFEWVFSNNLETGKECEIIPLMSKLGYKYNLLEGNYKFLRKITNLEDIF